MSKHFHHKNKKQLGFVLLLLGFGILISIITPPWLFALIIAIGLITAGIYIFFKDGRWNKNEDNGIQNAKVFK